MATFEKKELLAQLKTDVQQISQEIQALSAPDKQLLNKQPGFHQWSGAQVLEHLNFYNRAYLPVIEARMTRPAGKDGIFKSGWLGNYFTKVMTPGTDGKVANKMSAPKNARPVDVLDAEKVFAEFISGEQKLLSLLEKAATSDLDVRVPTSISKLIRLKTGDTFRFLIAHQQRHMAQFRRTIAAVR